MFFQGTLTEGEGSVQLTSLYQIVYITYIFYYFTKQTALLRRSTILSLPFQLVFLGSYLRDHNHPSIVFAYKARVHPCEVPLAFLAYVNLNVVQ